MSLHCVHVYISVYVHRRRLPVKNNALSRAVCVVCVRTHTHKYTGVVSEPLPSCGAQGGHHE